MSKTIVLSQIMKQKRKTQQKWYKGIFEGKAYEPNKNYIKKYPKAKYKRIIILNQM